MRRFLASLIAFAAVSCAVMEPPEGGPEDKTPPSIVSFVPAPGSTGVDRSTGMTITFTEKIDGESFRGKVLLFPPAEFSGIRSRGERLEIGFREQLPETTFAVVIRGGFSDLHNVRSGRSEIFYFSTSAVTDTGTVSGRILFKGAPDSSGVVHLLPASPADTVADPSSGEPARIAFAGRDGGFEFNALPTDGRPFVLWAFTDRNGDGRFSTQDEFALLSADTLVLDRARPRIDAVAIDIIDPDEPGSIAGRIIDMTGLGIAPTARFEGLAGETPAIVVKADSTGSYLVSSIAPGNYSYCAFIDVSGDSLAGSYVDSADSTETLPEPALCPADTVVVLPGKRIEADTVTLRKEGARAE
ncbi:MAG: Ig-like domain-containing protein [Candidatus Krumholzibacteria bacterium]|nr:Ig-like domain-containing protein [Candidatus Krumholzibacteria bacterium]